jgi:hypothetical protein
MISEKPPEQGETGVNAITAANPREVGFGRKVGFRKIQLRGHIGRFDLIVRSAPDRRSDTGAGADAN